MSAPRSQNTSVPSNRLLAALPPKEYRHVLSLGEVVSFGSRDVLYRTDGVMGHVFFPFSGVMSMVLIMLDGRTVEVAAVGNEGMVGLSMALQGQTSPTAVSCQVPSEALRVPRKAFLDELEKCGQFHSIIHQYTRRAISSSSQLIACNCLHSVEERCARWLLMTRDRIGSDDFPLTQETLSYMLGVRRASVSLAAGTLQSAGLITYSRGKVVIRDPQRLEEVSCECYQVMRGIHEKPFE